LSGLYLAGILFGLAGIATIDFRYRLALFTQTKRTLATLGIAVAFFLAWDLNGIGLGIFWEGSRTYLLGIDLLAEVPLEEPFFLLLLSYLLLVSYLGFQGRIFHKEDSKSSIDGSKRA
jgi:lycopene cyclase domain-containing protein